MSFDSSKEVALAEALAKVKLNPNSADNWNRAAIASLQVANLPTAIEYIGHAIAIEPEDALNYSNRGRILFELERQQEALADYTRAIELAPTSELYSSRSVVNIALGREAAALSDLTDAIELAPTAENFLNRVTFFAKKNMASDALRDISKVIELKPDDPNYRMTRANLAFALGLNEQGLSDIREAIRLDQSGALKTSLLQMANQLETYLATNPEDDVSHQLIELIRENQ